MSYTQRDARAANGSIAWSNPSLTITFQDPDPPTWFSPKPPLLCAPLDPDFITTLSTGAGHFSATKYRAVFSTQQQNSNGVIADSLRGSAIQRFCTDKLFNHLIHGRLSIDPVSATLSHKGFSLVDLLRMDPEAIIHTHDDSVSLPPTGFSSPNKVFQFIHRARLVWTWIVHPSFAHQTIFWKGLDFLEHELARIRLQSAWDSPSFNRPQMSVGIVEMIANLFSTIAAFTIAVPATSSVSRTVLTNGAIETWKFTPSSFSSFGGSADLDARLESWQAAVVQAMSSIAPPPFAMQYSAHTPAPITHILLRAATSNRDSSRRRDRDDHQDSRDTRRRHREPARDLSRTRDHDRPRDTSRQRDGPPRFTPPTSGDDRRQQSDTPSTRFRPNRPARDQVILQKSGITPSLSTLPQPQSRIWPPGSRFYERKSTQNLCIHYLFDEPCPRAHDSCGSFHLSLNYFPTNDRTTLDDLRKWVRDHSSKGVSFTTEALIHPMTKP